MNSDANADDATDPTLARYLLNSSIRQFRAADGRGPNVLANLAGVSARTWRRWMDEEDRPWTHPQILAAMGAFGYPSNDPVTLQMAQLAADTRKNNVVARPEWVRSTQLDLLVALEQVADEIRTCELTIMPGLLQTDAYARAHLEQLGYRDADLEERVQVRIARQSIIAEERARYVAVIDESVLHRSPDDSAVMTGQLQHLLDWSELPNVTIRVIPYAAGPYSTAGNGPFVIIDSQRVGRRITFVETSLSSTYYETREANERYARAMDVLADRSLGAKQSVEMIRGRLRAA